MKSDDKSIRVDPDLRTVLCAVNARTLAPTVSLATANTQLRWHGSGAVSWIIDCPEPVRVSPFLCCAVDADQITYKLTIAGRSMVGRISATMGYFDEGQLMNFERVAVQADVELPAGRSTAVLEIIDCPPNSVAVSSVELARQEVVAREHAIGDRLRDTHKSASFLTPYGLMFHWTSQSAPRSGPVLPYREAVQSFDVESFASMVAETGAGWVMLTANHAEPSFPAPIESWESLYPGWTTQRDLVAELVDALAKQGVRLFLYINTFAAYIRSDRFRNRDDTTEYSNDRRMAPECAEDYLETTVATLKEVGGRYGPDLAGYWFDSWYQPFMHFGSFPMEPVFRAAKEGNEDRLVTFNWWILPTGTPWVDYWAGEVAGLTTVPSQQPPQYGPGAGIPHHTLLIMDDPWVHSDIDAPISEPRLEYALLADHVRRSAKVNAPVTINLGIYQDGGVGPRSLDMLRRLRRAVAAAQ